MNHIITYHEKPGNAQLTMVSWAQCSCGKWKSMDHRGSLISQRRTLQKSAKQHLEAQ